MRSKPQDRKEELMIDTYTTSFQHLYYVNSFDPNTRGRHACLQNGFWCLENLLQHPKDIIKYLKGKLK